MSASDRGGTRMQRAAGEVSATLDRIDALGRDLCLKISTFDMEIAHLGEVRSASAARRLLEASRPRQLGTDLNLVRGLVQALEEQDQGGCPITHVVVISDLPAPDWVADFKRVTLVWRDVATPLANVGFTSVQAAQDPLTGLIRRVNLTARAFGPPPSHSRLKVLDPNGEALLEEVITWPANGIWRGTFTPEKAGRYAVSLSPGGAYDADDALLLDVDDERAIRVDWRLPDRQIVDALGWTRDSERAHLRVMPLPIDDADIPTLYVGDEFRTGQPRPSEVRDFLEGNPLLADLNLDVVESLSLAGIPLPAGFEPVLRRMDDRVWFARRLDPPAVYVPGLPAGGEANQAAFSATAFFNAVRWLLARRAAPPLYTLTSPAHPVAEGNRLALHEDEGQTYRETHSHGHLDNLKPVPLTLNRKPLWPLLLLLAVAFFLLERILALYGGEAWR